MVNGDSGERRKYVRIEDRLQVSYKLPVSYKLIDPEISSETRSPEEFFPHIWSKYPQSIILEESEDSNLHLLPHLIDLNRKIDILMDFLTSENKPQVEVPLTREVSISASGIKIDISEATVPGQKVALCIILPFVPPFKLFVTGEVTRCILLESAFPDDRILYETGIKFLDLGEEDQERIIKYIFKRQRDIIKDKKRLTNDETCDYNDT